MAVVVVEEGAGVEGVGRATGEESELGTQEIEGGAAEDTGDGEGGVKGGVGVVGGGVVDLAATAHSGKRVEHAGAAEADEAHENHLRQRGIEPGAFARRRDRCSFSGSGGAIAMFGSGPHWGNSGGSRIELEDRFQMRDRERSASPQS